MRRPRLELPGFPLHITQRGVNRAPVFIDDTDCHTYMQALQIAAKDQCVAINGYVLMGNHIHLLASAQATGAVSRMMQALGRRYVRAFNDRHGRSGTLWEGRYKSCLVDTDRYFMACLRYIELNPVRAGMVKLPWEHRWSSVHGHLGLRDDPVLTSHAVFLELQHEPSTRADAYRELLLEPLLADQLENIRNHVRQERAYGSPDFQAIVAHALGRPAGLRSVGRPPVRAANSNANVL